jgi:hypothetical protein
VKAPEIDSVEPNSGLFGDLVTISGKFFGMNQGRVYLVNDQPTKRLCRIESWTYNPKTNEGKIVFVVPKSLLPGIYDVIVTNSVWSDTKVGGFILID